MAKPLSFRDGRLVRLHTRLVDFPLPCESAASQYRVGLLRFESGRVLVFHGGVFECSSRMNGKPSSPVLRGLGASDGARLLDPNRVMSELPVIHREPSASTHATAVAPIIGERRQMWNECFLPLAATAASHSPPWLPSGGDRDLQCGKADTPRQVLETWVIPQAVHARVYMKIDKPVRVLFVGFLQVFHSAVVFSQADMYPGQEVGCDILLLC